MTIFKNSLFVSGINVPIISTRVTAIPDIRIMLHRAHLPFPTLPTPSPKPLPFAIHQHRSQLIPPGRPVSRSPSGQRVIPDLTPPGRIQSRIKRYTDPDLPAERAEIAFGAGSAFIDAFWAVAVVDLSALSLSGIVAVADPEAFL